MRNGLQSYSRDIERQTTTVMDVILQKIKADIASRPLLSLLLVVTIIVASALLTLALTTLMNISAPYDKSFEELNGAHLWLYFNRNRVRLRDITRIESLPGVVESTGLQYSIESRVRIRDLRVWTSIRSTPVEQPQVNRLLVLRLLRSSLRDSHNLL